MRIRYSTRWSFWKRPLFCALLLCITSFHYPMDVLRVHIGKAHESVVQDSTFPVLRKTVNYPSDPPEVDSTWISSPVVMKFDDLRYGFTLPPTKFGAIGYRKEKVSTITTSPMLETVSFEQLVPLIEQLQAILKEAGWEPRDREDNAWLSVDNEAERSALQKLLFDQVVLVMLLVPHKYGLALNVKCYARCDERDPKTAKYLIDVSVGKDYYSE